MRNSSDFEVEIYLIRHGYTKGNLEKRYIGMTDEPLAKEGRETLLGKSFPQMEAVFVSPLLRCRETAEILFPREKYKSISELSEMNFGEFEGKNYMDLQGDDRYQCWIDSGGTIAFPNGESRDEFIERTLRGFRKALEEATGKKRIAIVAHGGTIMAILSVLHGGDYFDYQVKNGEGYRGKYQRKNGKEKIIEIEKI